MLQSFFKANGVEAGCDEAGRGCLAGPVVAAAVILPKDFSHPMLDDSKKLSEKRRDVLRIVVEKEAIAYSVAFVFPEEIDRINILNASFLAMHKAVDDLSQKPSLLLIDGNRFTPYPEIAHECIVKGDSKFLSIAAASILAKTYRDEYMMKIAEEHPDYNWQSNKGYPTKSHRLAIAKNGACKYHRRSFRLLPEMEQGKLFKGW